MKKAYLLLFPIFLFIGTLANAQAGYISTVAFNGDIGFSGDGGPALAAECDTMMAAAADDSGNVYISDPWNWRVRKVYAKTGIIITVAGNGIGGYSGDGGQATDAELNFTWSVGVDPKTGDLYICDETVVRKVVQSTGIISTFAGDGVDYGYTGNGGKATAAELNVPAGIAFANNGDVYIADFDNSTIQVVRAADSNIYTIAGNGNWNAGPDVFGGPATASPLNGPIGIVYDNTNNTLYFDDDSNFVVCAIPPSGILELVAGVPLSNSYNLSNGPATTVPLGLPTGLALDKNGNLWIADPGDNIIRTVDMSTHYEQVAAGNGNYGWSGDGGPALDAEMSYPWSVALDGAQNVYIADLVNFRIRKINAEPVSVPQIKNSGDFAVYPNPVNNTLTVQFSGASSSGNNTIEVEDIMGKTISSFNMEMKPSANFKLDVSKYAAGLYFIKISGNNSSQVFKFVKE